MTIRVSLVLLTALGMTLGSQTARAEHEGKVQIVLLGDSTTEGSIPRRMVPQGPHLEEVIRGQLATHKDLPPTNVINLGQNGDTLRRLLDSGRYEKEASKLSGVDYILIRYGLNDVNRRENFDENFPKDYHELIARLKADHPHAQVIIMTVIPYGAEAICQRINTQNFAVAKDAGLTLFDIYPRYSEELKHGENMLNYRRYPLDKIPENQREFVKPFVVDGNPPTVEVMDNCLDAHFRDLPGWFGDRHPNLAGYHVIGDETAKFLAPLIRAKFAAGAAAEPQKVGLWNGNAPTGDGKTEDCEVWLTLYRPAKPNGTAVVICPGGGYGGHAIQPEGHGIAKWLNQSGVTGVVLEYRLPAGRHSVPMLDAQRAIRTVRSRAQVWGINPARIGIIGFSAGGHLASTAATHFDAGQPQSTDPIEQASSRPDFAILVYPVITMGKTTHSGSRTNLLGPNPTDEFIELYSNEKQVTDQTPPTFLAHAIDDGPVPPDNSRLFFKALQAHKVPSKYLELPDGGHGLNGYKGPSWDAWQTQSLDWLRELKLMPAAQ